MDGRTAVLALLVAAAGCAQQRDAAQPAGSVAHREPASPLAAHAPIRTHTPMQDVARPGEFVAYFPSAVRREGAYTWYRAETDERGAIRAIAHGPLRLTTPSGVTLAFLHDRHVRHASGDWTWVGHLAGSGHAQAILTFVAGRVIGTIDQPGKPSLRLAIRDGATWMGEADPARLPTAIAAATRAPDFLLAPKPRRDGTESGNPASRRPRAALAPVPRGGNAALEYLSPLTPTPMVDVVIGYSTGFQAQHGIYAVGQLEHLIEVGNAAYANSQVDARIRMVAAVPIAFPDDSSNDDALRRLSGYDEVLDRTTAPDAAFKPLLAAREKYGADLVTFVRRFDQPVQESCGVAWLLGGARQGIAPGDGWDSLAYSVVSDGIDEGYYCEEHTLVHELGHGMGLAHDLITAEGSNFKLDPDEYGAFDYSFGYNAIGRCSTVMAYGDSGAFYRGFSNPDILRWDYPCGVEDRADNARALRLTMPVVAGFRATVVPRNDVLRVRDDFNLDGRSDVLWRHSASGTNVLWASAQQAMSTVLAAVPSGPWRIVGTGDFDGDGRPDILWRNFATGANTIWRAGNARTPQAVATVADFAWNVVAVADFDGDFKADIFWRNSSTGANTLWKSGNARAPRTIQRVAGQDWYIAGVSQFGGAASALWRNRRTGANALWYGADATQATTLSALDPEWDVAAVGVLANVSGGGDILWRNRRTGANVVWAGGRGYDVRVLPTVASADWQVETAGDYDGDGFDDILWRNRKTGANVVWRMPFATKAIPMAPLADLGWTIAN